MTKKIQNMNSTLMLSSGEVLKVKAVGYKTKIAGELCFNTSSTGYQEIMTDPSYSNQIIVFTFPHIGNTGINNFDYESEKIHAKAIIVRELPTEDSNFRSTCSFIKWLEDNKIICIYGVDTRALTKKIRKNPSLKAVIEYSDNDSNEIALKDDLNSFDYDVDLVKSNSCQENYDFKDSTWDFTNGYSQQNDAHYKVVVIDYGVKKNILRYLNKYNLNVTVVPANTSYDDIKKLNPDGVLLSNGAGNPEQVINYTTDTIKKLIDSNIPILAICLGHQLLSMTLGCEIIKMQQGHRGCNHPVQDVNNRKVYITSQNHGYAVDSNKISSDVEVTHYSLFDNTIQGISVKNKKILSVQGHPESSSGPHDFEYIFQEFYNFIDKNK